MFALLSASLAASEAIYSVPMASVLCNNSQTEILSGFKTGMEIAVDNVQGCKLSAATELERCTLFKWTVEEDNSNAQFVELQCTGGQSCALSRYADNATWKNIILSPGDNQLQSIMLADNSMMVHTTSGELSQFEHDNTQGRSCSNTCTVRVQVTPHGDKIYVAAKVGNAQTAGSFNVLGSQFVIFSGASHVSLGLSLLVLVFFMV